MRSEAVGAISPDPAIMTAEMADVVMEHETTAAQAAA